MGTTSSRSPTSGSVSAIGSDEPWISNTTRAGRASGCATTAIGASAWNSCAFNSSTHSFSTRRMLGSRPRRVTRRSTVAPMFATCSTRSIAALPRSLSSVKSGSAAAPNTIQSPPARRKTAIGTGFSQANRRLATSLAAV